MLITELLGGAKRWRTPTLTIGQAKIKKALYRYRAFETW